MFFRKIFFISSAASCSVICFRDSCKCTIQTHKRWLPTIQNNNQQHHQPSDALDHLDKQAESHADTDAFREVNKQVFELLLPELPPKNAHVLDLGCGPGGISILLAKMTQVESVVGIDISEVMISRANHYKQQIQDNSVQSKLTFIQQTERYPKAELEVMKGTKELVVMSFVLGHIAPKQAGSNVLALGVSTLKSGGKFALAEFVYTPGEGEDGMDDGDDHHLDHHNHSHSHRHEHYRQHNHGDSGGFSLVNDEEDKSHHGGHVAFSEEEIRQLFKDIGLEPALQFTAFEFSWFGRSIKSIMAVGTKR